MITVDIKNRLKSAGTPFSVIEGANQLADVKDNPPTTPAAYVFINSEASAENQRVTGAILQRCQVDISVVIITDNAGSDEDLARDIDVLKAWVRQQLLGFEPAGAEPLEHVSGKILHAKDSLVWFEDVFGTATYLESQT